MTIAVWPSRLPQPNASGYSEGIGDPRRFTQYEQGPPRSRRRTSNAVNAVQMTLTVDDSERATFDKFWLDTTADGSILFTMPDKGRDFLILTDENDEVLTDENDEPLAQTETWLCMFGQGGPQHRALGAGIWQISFPLVIYP
jgi:hypothetical protein